MKAYTGQGTDKDMNLNIILHVPIRAVPNENIWVFLKAKHYNFVGLVAVGCFFMSPHRRGGGHIVFGVDPVGVGIIVGVGVSVTLSCLHDIS